ncbi:MAG TPA: hypothetical protein VL403_18515 [Candidatus Kryptonia bacterium]|nr:hypothetical protein [Candidatus Kryptonia bacterium]
MATRRTGGESATGGRVAALTVALCLVAACRWGANNPANTEKELAGVGYSRQLVALIQALQNHRSIATAFVDGDTSVDFATPEEHIASQYVIVNRFDLQHGELDGARQRWTPLGKDILALMDSWREQPRECFRRHTDSIAAALALLAHINDASTLGSDTAADIHSLADAATNAIPNLTEIMAQTRDLVSSMAGQAAVVRDEEHQLFGRHLANIRKYADQIKSDYEAAYAVDAGIRSQLEPQREQVSQVMAPVLDRLEHKVLESDYVKMTPDDWTPKATLSVESIQTLHEQALTVLQARLTARK